MTSLIFTPLADRASNLLQGLDASSTTVIHENLDSQLQSLQPNSLEKVIIEINDVSTLSQDSLHKLYSATKPDGTVQIVNLAPENIDLTSLADSCTISGFKLGNCEKASLNLSKPAWAGKGVATLKKKAAPTQETKANGLNKCWLINNAL